LCIPIIDIAEKKTNFNALEMEDDKFQRNELPLFEGKHFANTPKIDKNDTSIIEEEFSALMTHNR
jgi:hypothetical protein